MIDMQELEDLEDARANRTSAIDGGYRAPVDIRASAPVGPSSITFIAPDPKLARPDPPPMDRGEFDRMQGQTLPGDALGVKLMHTKQLLEAAGPQWLTEAFHAAGSLPKDNAVIAIRKMTSFEGGGAGLKATLDVEYATPDPSLHTELFVKLPHESDQGHKYLIDAYLNQNQPETSFARLVGHLMPFRTPKVYFADHCRRTTNFVLITERVPFATGAYERAHDKYLDRFLPRPPAHYYLVLMQQLGRMVAAYKTGTLGTELERHFPCEPRQAPPAKPDDMKMLRYQIDGMFSFARDTMPQMLTPDVRADKEFLNGKAANEMLHALCYYQEAIRRLNANPDYLSFAHPNLNIDNAWWWSGSQVGEDEEGTGSRMIGGEDVGDLQCGVLDWGGFRCRAISSHIHAAIFAGECHLVDTHHDTLLQVFVDACHEAGGPLLHMDELRLHMVLTLIVSIPPSAGTVGVILRHTKKAEWATIQDRADPRFEGRFLVRCYALGIIDLLARWKRHGIYDTFKRWVAAEGLEHKMHTV